METKHILMFLGVIVLTVVPLIMYAGHEGYFEGADDAAVGAITHIEPNYKPWFKPIWEPPSGEIESFLFALQAAIGAIVIGYFIGYYKGKREIVAQH